jgi:hypothetical protein
MLEPEKDARQQDLLNQAGELGPSGLFDAAWYLKAYPDVRHAGLDPLRHFVWWGWQEGRKPNAYFDPTWYLTANPDVVDVGLNPLLHYLRHGDLEGRRPIGHFDPVWYRKAHDLAEDRLALRHFLPRRATGAFAPCAALFAVRFLPPYRELPALNEDPYEQYVEDMRREQQEMFPDPALIAASGLFDADYYFSNATDVRDAALDPLLHFCYNGARERRKPNFYFDTGWYVATNPRVGQLGLNPLVHYVCEGEAGNRRPAPYFDPGWYRATYRIPPEQNALAHYLAHRGSQGFSPNSLFDVAWYVARHADTLGAERDPFAHFLQNGRRGQVDPSPAFNAAEYRQQHIGELGEAVQNLVHAEAENPLVHHLLADYR